MKQEKIVSVRLLILKYDQMLIIKRFNKGRKYCVLPGGHVEKKETPVKAASRELKEETCLTGDLKFISNFKTGDEIGALFIVTNFSGKIGLGGPEKKKNSKENNYKLLWLKIADINKTILYPQEAVKLAKALFKKRLPKEI